MLAHTTNNRRNLAVSATPDDLCTRFNFISARTSFPYTVNFENIPTATAAAQRIRVTDQLDPNLDARTFRLKEIGFGSYRVTVPDNRAFYQTRVQLGADLGNLLADLSAGVDIATGQVTWTLTAIDPQTGEPPASAALGLLPPNDATGRGQGYVTYTVQPKATAPTGTQVANSATITFDTNEPIPTNTVSNTLDADPPASAVAPLPASSQPTFTVALAGDDPAGGSGLQSYDVWVSDNDGPYQPFVTGTTDTSAQFTGTLGHTYRFYSVARDNAGNVEAAPNAPDAVTVVGTLPTVGGRITISGVGLDGVTVTLVRTSGQGAPETRTATTGGGGSYSFANVTAGENYTVTPAKAFYTFTPAKQDFNNLSGDTTANFTAALQTYTISGQVTADGTGLAGVTVTLSGSSASTLTTDATGRYTFGVPAGGTYTVTPTKTNYAFVPATRTFTNLSGDQTQDFAGALVTYTVGGTITDAGGVGVAGVLVTLGGSQSRTATTGANGAYSFGNVTAGGDYTLTPSKPFYTFTPPTRTITNLGGDQPAANFTATGAPKTVQFSAADYSVGEGDGRVTLTITRTGDPAAAATVDYKTIDTDTFTVGCSDTAHTNGAAYGRCDFATSLDTLTFAAGETQKTFTVPVIDDAHVEGDETFQVQLSNATGASLGTPATATVTIKDNDQPGEPNPTYTIPFFVRQQYLDFLGREPEQGEPWSGVLQRCQNDIINTPPEAQTDCDRIDVSKDFFASPEFQLKGVYVIGFYRVTLNRLPTYAEFVQDLRAVTGTTAQETAQKRAAFAVAFTQRQEFTNLYGTFTNQAFVDRLLGHYQVGQITTLDPQNPEANPPQKVTLTNATLVSRLSAGTLTRAQVVRAAVEADEGASVKVSVTGRPDATEREQAFVAAQYYGYLRRTPEAGGFVAWLRVLQGGNVRAMVNGFLNSQEYQLRFGRIEH